MRQYSVDVEWMDASEHAEQPGDAQPATHESDSDVAPILEYRPQEAATSSTAAAEGGGGRAIPKLTSDQCSAIKGACGSDALQR
jgi:hypothetical protein